MLELQTLNCGNCGAPLEIPTSVNYVTCRYCNSQLHVQRTESIAFTEVIHSLQAKTQQLSETTEVLRLRQALNQLDQNWLEKVNPTSRWDKQRLPEHPSPGWTIVRGVLSITLCLFLILYGVTISPFYPVFGILGIPLVIIALIRGFHYQNALAVQAELYQARRHELLDELARLSRVEPTLSQ